MAVWVIRGGSYEEEALEDGKISIDYGVFEGLEGCGNQRRRKESGTDGLPTCGQQSDRADNRPIMEFQEKVLKLET